MPVITTFEDLSALPVGTTVQQRDPFVSRDFTVVPGGLTYGTSATIAFDMFGGAVAHNALSFTTTDQVTERVVATAETLPPIPQGDEWRSLPRVPSEDLRVGDVFMFWDGDQRWARVTANNGGDIMGEWDQRSPYVINRGALPTGSRGFGRFAGRHTIRANPENAVEVESLRSTLTTLTAERDALRQERDNLSRTQNMAAADARLRQALVDWARGTDSEEVESVNLESLLDEFDIEWRGEADVEVTVSFSGSREFDVENLMGGRAGVEETVFGNTDVDWADTEESVITFTFEGETTFTRSVTSGSCACDTIEESDVRDYLDNNGNYYDDVTITNRSCENC